MCLASETRPPLPPTALPKGKAFWWGGHRTWPVLQQGGHPGIAGIQQSGAEVLYLYWVKLLNTADCDLTHHTIFRLSNGISSTYDEHWYINQDVASPLDINVRRCSEMENDDYTFLDFLRKGCAANPCPGHLSFVLFMPYNSCIRKDIMFLFSLKTMEGTTLFWPGEELTVISDMVATKDTKWRKKILEEN